MNLEKEIKEILQSSGLSLFECDKTETDAQEFVQQNLRYVHDWLKRFAPSNSEGTDSIERLLSESCEQMLSKIVK